MAQVQFNHFVQQPQKADREESEMSRNLSLHSCNEESESPELEAVESLLKEVLGRGHMEHGCPHYRRRCCIRSPCCNEIFGCHHCHYEAKNSINVDQRQRHDIPRQKVEQVICLLCGTEQEVRQTCINCGVCMGKYFCEVCKLYDDDTSKKQYHCDGCGICRIGGRENFFHCYKCGCCYSILLKDSHPCVEGAMHHDCPICFEFLFESRNDVTVLPCGHTIHQKCLEEMREHYQYACPLCSKSVCDMSKVWEKFDVEIAATPMPEPYQNRMVQILCNDCGKKSALMSLLRQDPKASSTALFTHAGVTPTTDDQIREKALNFIRDKVFPIKGELLKPQEEMERHITDLIKQSLEDVTGGEFKMFMDFLTSLSIFGGKAPPERMQELVEIIEGQADLNSQFDVSDTDHIDRLISCLQLALPFFARGAPSSKFLNYLNKHIIPVFDELPEERKLDLLKALADISPYTTAQEARQMLPSIVQLLKKYMPARKAGEEMNFTYVECLLYVLHHLAHKVPNATNSLCGYKIVTGQPSDRLGEDFSELNKDFTERLTTVEDLTKATMKKLTQGMSEHSKAMSAAKTDEEKASVKTKKQNTTTGLRTCNNILAMTKPLHAKAPSFIGDTNINLSWKEATKPLASATTTTTIGGKRPAHNNNGSGNNVAAKRGRGSGGVQSQLVNKAFEGISPYGGGGRGGNRSWGRRGGGRGRGQGRGHW